MSFQSLGILLKDCCRFDSQALLIRLGTFLWPMKSQSKFMSWWSVEINYLLLFFWSAKTCLENCSNFFSSLVIIGWWTTDSENYHHPITSDKNSWDTFRNITLICNLLFYLFASCVSSLIPPAPQFNVVHALWSAQSWKYKNQHCLGGKR